MEIKQAESERVDIWSAVGNLFHDIHLKNKYNHRKDQFAHWNWVSSI